MIGEYPVSNIELLAGLILFGYLEMHYRFRFFPFSLYFKREPEIIFDAPHRLDPGKMLPITLLIKDADKYPITLNSVQVDISDSNGQTITHHKDFSRKIDTHWFGGIIEVDISYLRGSIKARCTARYKRKWFKRKTVNHNVRTSRHYPLVTLLASDTLPGAGKFWWGDLHFHSNYTEDFVEFGAPLSVVKATAYSQGLDFVGITDHSYDLDDKPGSWTESDPELLRWQASRQEITNLNQSAGTVLLPGEEVTVRNVVDRNIHLLVFNHPEFIPGSGDGAEHWFKTTSEHSVPDVLDQIDATAVAIAAHPATPTPFMERLMIKRGQWEKEDLFQPRLDGWQVFNGYRDTHVDGFANAWVRTLLEGEKKYIYAGNDAHGNFNFFHQIKLPMIATHHHRRQIPGKWRTGVFPNGDCTMENITLAIKSGRCIVSDGPAVLIHTIDKGKLTYGDSIQGLKTKLRIECYSSAEYGTLKELRILHGWRGQKQEKLVLHQMWAEEVYTSIALFALDLNDQPGYLRALFTTVSGHICMTNPIWINHD